ncbi:MAG: FHA domain-containing protein, partial [Myxococcales bacterium]
MSFSRTRSSPRRLVFDIDGLLSLAAEVQTRKIPHPGGPRRAPPEPASVGRAGARAGGRLGSFTVSLWSRFWRRLAPADLPAGAQALEEKGDLAAAAVEYEREGLPDESVRLLLIVADADPDPTSRVRTLGRALRVASVQGEPPEGLPARYARARLDVLRATAAGAAPVWELTALARELEELGEPEAAAEAYGLAGDRPAQVRLLAASGKIEELEGVLARENERTRSGRVRNQLLAEAAALTSGGQRAEALRRALVFADLHPGDDEVAAVIRSLQDRLVRPPAVSLEVSGRPARYLLLDEVVIGRRDAPLIVASPMLSRAHLRIWRVDGVPTVADLGSRNGTLLAGARLGAPLAVRGPLALRLGGEVACTIEPLDGGVLVTVGGERHVVPLART